jgi:hypothetical protein
MKYFFLFLPIVLLACSQSKYGSEYNPERIKRGIPIIYENWITQPSTKESVIWTPPEGRARTTAEHDAKVIILEKNIITKEVDGFINEIDSNNIFGLTIEYDYLTQLNHWKCTVTDLKYKMAKKKTGKASYDISIIQADSVLASWGLSRTGK